MQGYSDIIFAPIKGRVYKYLKDNKIRNSDFYKRVGISPSSFKGNAKMSEFGGDILAKIITEYPDIDAEWLLLGTTRSKPTIDSINVLHSSKTREAVYSQQTVNLYEFEASAGLRTLFDNNKPNIIDTIHIPNLPKCDGAIHIVGDSMYPILKSGDIILYREMPLAYDEIYFGETYLLSYFVDESEVAVVVKYVQRGEQEGHIKLVSHNPHHAPREIDFRRVNAMALVKASIRINAMY